MTRGDSNAELHSFVKLAIAYLGIMAGFAVLGYVFYEIGAREGPAITSVPAFAPSEVYLIAIAFFWIITGLSLAAVFGLIKNLRIGAYVAFIVLIFSLFAPYEKQSGAAPFTMIWWFAIPNAIVGILLLRASKTLSSASMIIAKRRDG